MNKLEKQIRKEKAFIQNFISGIKKKIHTLTDERNNGHHPVYILPEHCVPSGMCKSMGRFRKVVIKDLETAEFVEDSTIKDLDIIIEQFEYAIEDIYEMKDYVDACKELYSEYKDDVNLTGSMKLCWDLGKKFTEENDLWAE